MRTTILGGLTLGLLVPTAMAQTTASAPAGYDDPGPKPTNVLPAILNELRRTMKDPYSIRDFAMCEPEASKPFKYPGDDGRWERSHWKVNFVLNAKNGFGGYAGLTYFAATYENGQLTSVARPNLGPALNAKLVDLAKDCPRIADAEIQRLLAQ